MFTAISDYRSTCLSRQRSTGQPQNLLGYCKLGTSLKVRGAASILTSWQVSPKPSLAVMHLWIDIADLSVTLTTTKCAAPAWAAVFMQHVFCNHSFQLEVISDGGPDFEHYLPHTIVTCLQHTRALAEFSCSLNMLRACELQANDETELSNCIVKNVKHFVSSAD